LKLSPEKTMVTNITEGFDFLGWNFRKYKVGNRFKLIIKPSKGPVKSFLEKIKGMIDNKSIAMTQDILISSLNPVIRGWCDYHRSTCASKTFRYLDNEIFWTLYRWALRRHKNKGKHWVKSRYWHCENGSKWIFRTDEKTLLKLQSSEIKRHVKVVSEKSPYVDHEYFQERK